MVGKRYSCLCAEAVHIDQSVVVCSITSTFCRFECSALLMMWQLLDTCGKMTDYRKYSLVYRFMYSPLYLFIDGN